MKKVVHIVEDLKIGGIERVIENIVTSFDPQRFKVYVLCLTRGGAIAERLIANHQNVEIMNIENYHSPLALVKVVKWLRRRKIDIVHTHGYPAGVLGRLAAIVTRIHYIFHHIHSTFFNLNKRSYFIESFLGQFTHNVICCSEAVKRAALEKTGIAKNKLTVIYNGTLTPNLLDDLTLTSVKKELNIPLDISVIGCVASLVQHKGHRYLLEALQKIDNAYLILIGDGPLRQELKSNASKLNIANRVIFAGLKLNVAPYMQVMDIIVLPSTEREGLGLSLIEAMSLSKPVIATNIGGIPEVVDNGRTGILVKPNESDALANAMSELLKSPDLIRNMGLKGRDKYLKMFTLNQMIRRIGELYEGM